MAKRTMKTQSIPTRNIDELTDAELTLMLARESLRRYGTPIPPPGAMLGLATSATPAPSPAVPSGTAKAVASQTSAAPAAVPKPARRRQITMKSKEEIEREEHKCPKCERKGTVARMFGTRMVQGVLRKQSYCYDCRAKLNYKQAR